MSKVMETIVEEVFNTDAHEPEVEIQCGDLDYDSDFYEHLDDVCRDVDADDLDYSNLQRVNSLIDDITNNENAVNDTGSTATRLFYRWMHILIDDFRYYNSQPILTAFVKCFYPSLPSQTIADICVNHGYILTNGIVGDAAQDLGTIMDVVINLCRLDEVDGNIARNKFQFVFDMAYEYGQFTKQEPIIEELVIGHMLFVSILNACDNELYKTIFDLLWTNDVDLVGFQISSVWWDEIKLSKEIYSELQGDWKMDYVGEGIVGIVIAIWNEMHASDCLTYVGCLDKLLSYRKWAVLDNRKKLYTIDHTDKDIAYYSSHAARTSMDTLIPLRIITNLLEYDGQHVKMHVMASKIQLALQYFGFAYYYDSIRALEDYVVDLVSLHEYYMKQSDKPFTGETMYERVKERTRGIRRHKIRFTTESTASSININYGICSPINRRFTQEVEGYKLEVSTGYDCDLHSGFSTEHVISNTFCGSKISNSTSHQVPVNRIYTVPFSDVFFPIVKENLIPHKHLGVICLDDKLNAILMNLLLSFRTEEPANSDELCSLDNYYKDDCDSFTFSNYNSHFGRYVLYDKVNKYYSGTGHCLFPTPMPFLNCQNVRSSARTIKLMSGAQFHMLDSCTSHFNANSGHHHIQPVCRSCGNIGTSQYIVRVCETLHNYTRSHFDANLRYFSTYKDDYYKHDSYKTNKHPALRSLRTNSNKLLRSDYDDNRDYEYTTLTTPKACKNKKSAIDSQTRHGLVFSRREDRLIPRTQLLVHPQNNASSPLDTQNSLHLPTSLLQLLAIDSQIVPGLFKAPFSQSRLHGDDVMHNVVQLNFSNQSATYKN